MDYGDILVLLFLCLVPLYCMWVHIHPKYGRNPGVMLFPLVGCLLSIFKNKHRLNEWGSQALHSTPTLTCRMAIANRVVISTANPANVQHILKTRFESYPKGQAFYLFFSDLLGNGILNVDGHLWRLQRKAASHEFTTTSLREFTMEVIAAQIKTRLFPALSAAAVASLDVADSPPLDLQQLFFGFTFGTTCKLIFGNPPCDEGGFEEAFDIATSVTAYRFVIPPFVWKLKRALGVGNEKKLREAIKVVNKFASSVIQRKRKENIEHAGSCSSDLLSRFMGLDQQFHAGNELDLDLKEMGSLLPNSDSFVRDILLSFLMAGRDTVASALVFFIWLLCHHPRVEKALLKEISSLPSSTTRGGEKEEERGFSFEDLKQMNYLHAALSEAMRLYPPVPSDCKYAMEDDVLPDGTQVRRGYQVSYNVYAMGRAQRLWGSDCLEFKPERWLNEDGQFVPESPYKYPVFQAGPRICLGRELTYLQLKLIVASLITEFEFKLVLSSEEKDHPQYAFGITLKMANGLPVLVTKRSKPNMGLGDMGIGNISKTGVNQVL